VGVTARGRTVSSPTIDNDGSEVASRSSSFGLGSGTITFASLGTSPSATLAGSRLRAVMGTGSPSTGTITIPHNLGKVPSKVFLNDRGGTVRWYVSTADATNIVLTAVTAPAASAVQNLDLIVE
jgi:hypothetical protein